MMLCMAVLTAFSACQSSRSASPKHSSYQKDRVRYNPHWNSATSPTTTYHIINMGRLNDDELFYMRSRGISLDEAKKIQLTVFAAAALDIVPEDVSAGLQGWIDAISR